MAQRRLSIPYFFQHLLPPPPTPHPLRSFTSLTIPPATTPPTPPPTVFITKSVTSKKPTFKSSWKSSMQSERPKAAKVTRPTRRQEPVRFKDPPLPPEKPRTSDSTMPATPPERTRTAQRRRCSRGSRSAPVHSSGTCGRNPASGYARQRAS